MKRFKDWSIIYKSIIPFALLIVVFLINFFMIYYSIKQQKYYTIKHDVAQRNQLLTHKMAFLAQKISNSSLNETSEAQDKLSQSITVFTNSLETLKGGGTPPGYNTEIEPASDNLLQYINAVNNFWLNYHSDLLLILNQKEQQTQEVDTLQVTDSLLVEALAEEKLKDRKNEVIAAIENIEMNTGELQLRCENVRNQIVKERNEEQQSTVYFLVFLIIIIIIIGIGIYINYYFLMKPVFVISHEIDKIAEGDLKNAGRRAGFQNLVGQKNETGRIAQRIWYLRNHLMQKVDFISKLSNGEYHTEFDLSGDKDMIGKALLEMKQSFANAAEAENKRKEKDKQQQALTEGQNAIAQILRSNTDNIEQLSYEVIQYIVSFLDVNQGAIFIKNDDDEQDVYLELTAAIAYGQKRILNKRMEMNEGITGRAIQEKRTVHLTEIPDEYIDISSGLGQAQPKVLLIVPLQFNEEIFGAVEIASFQPVASHQIQFVEEISGSIASSISSLKISIKTTRLLAASKQQADELAAKEEQMRENMDKLKTIQEESARKEAEAVGFVNSVNHSIIRADYNLEGNLLYANSKFLKKMEYTTFEAEGKHVTEFLYDVDKDYFMRQWHRIEKGGRHIEEEMHMKTKQGGIWLLVTYTPVRDVDNSITSILFLGIDIHDQKSKNLDYAGELHAINQSVMKAEFNIDGTIIHANDIFLDTYKYKHNEIENRDIYIFLDSSQMNTFHNQWRDIVNGKPFAGQIQQLTKNSENLWVQANFNAVRNSWGKVYKIVFIGYDITAQKKMELNSEKQTNELQKVVQENKEKTFFYQQILDSIPFPISVTDLNRRWMFINRIIAEELHGDRNLLLGKLCGEWNKAICNTERCSVFKLQKGITLNEYKQNDKDYKANTFYLKNLNGEKTGHIEIIQDITEQKQTEKKVDELLSQAKQSKQLLQQKDDELQQKSEQLIIVQNELKQREAEISNRSEAIKNTIAVAEYSRQGKILTANDIFYELFGYSEVEMQGKHHRILVDPQFRNTQEYKEFWKNLNSGSEQEGVYKYITKDATPIYLKGRYTFIRYNEKQNYRILFLAYDITELRKQVAELRGHLETINRSNLLAEFSLNGMFIHANEIFQKTFGYSLYELKGRHHALITTETDKESGGYQKMWLNLKSGISQQGEFKRIKNNEDEIFLKEIFFPVSDSEGIPYKIIYLATDITTLYEQQNILEQQAKSLKKNEDELRMNIEEMQATQEDMFQKQKELEETREELKSKEVILQQAIDNYKKTEELQNQQIKQLIEEKKKLKNEIEILRKQR